MGSMKGAGALIAALVPIAYCGAMIYYFAGVGGSVQGVAAIGLGPTVLGLGAIGLLFCVPLLLRILKLVGTPPPKPGAQPRLAVNVPEEEAFDADAALARYLARKAEAGEESQTVAAGEPISVPSTGVRPTFGRKIA
ncbi:MAG: hypothetical protein ABIR08_02875 [Sphingomonas sp.]